MFADVEISIWIESTTACVGKRILVPKQLFAGVRNFKHSNSPQIERAHKELWKLSDFLHRANGLLKYNRVFSVLAKLDERELSRVEKF
jgi:hypothetical protein